MCATPTKPYCDITAKFALKIYKLFSMLIAVFGLKRATLRAYKLFWIKLFSIFLLVHSLSTIFSPSKIWFFAFKALKVSIQGHRILFLIFVIS